MKKLYHEPKINHQLAADEFMKTGQAQLGAGYSSKSSSSHFNYVTSAQAFHSHALIPSTPPKKKVEDLPMIVSNQMGLFPSANLTETEQKHFAVATGVSAAGAISALHDFNVLTDDLSNYHTQTSPYRIKQAYKTSSTELVSLIHTKRYGETMLGFGHDAMTPIGYSLIEDAKETLKSNKKTPNVKNFNKFEKARMASTFGEKGIGYSIYGSFLLSATAYGFMGYSLARSENLPSDLRQEVASTLGAFTASQLARPVLLELEYKAIFSESFNSFAILGGKRWAANPYIAIPTAVTFAIAGAYGAQAIDISMGGDEMGASMLQMTKTYYQDFKALKQMHPSMIKNLGHGLNTQAFFPELKHQNFEAMLEIHNTIVESLHAKSSPLGKAKIANAHVLNLNWRGSEGTNIQTYTVARKVPSTIPNLLKGDTFNATLKIMEEIDGGYLLLKTLKNVKWLVPCLGVGGLALSGVAVAQAEGIDNKIREAIKQTLLAAGALGGGELAAMALTAIGGACAVTPVCAGSVLIMSGAGGAFAVGKYMDTLDSAAKELRKNTISETGRWSRF